MGAHVISMLSAAGTAVTASSTETVGSYVAIPAGTFANGKQIRVNGHARATATNSTDTLTVKAYSHTAAAIASGTELATSGAVDAANDDVVTCELVFSPRSAAGSSSGSIVVSGFFSAVGAEGTVTTRAVHQVLSSIDFNAVLYVGLTLKWSTTSSGNSAQVEALDVVEIW